MNTMKSHITFVSLIFAITTLGWWFLGATMQGRTEMLNTKLEQVVNDVWGPPLTQTHPTATLSSDNHRTSLLPAKSEVFVDINYAPRLTGLIKQRTYDLNYKAGYEFTNPTEVTQILQLNFQTPAKQTMCDQLKFEVTANGKTESPSISPEEGLMTTMVELKPKEHVQLNVEYKCRGSDNWTYRFPAGARLQNFALAMETNFREVNFPVHSPSLRTQKSGGYHLEWNYSDAIATHGVGIDMPSELQAGPIAAKVSFYVPLSLFLFFGVIGLSCLSRGVRLHPINYFFIACGFFAFPLLFAYSLDVIPPAIAFGIASTISVVLVCGYLRTAAGPFIFGVAIPAQLAYMVLFNLSFFFKGLTGLTITVVAIATLAVVMMLTAKIDWTERLQTMK